VGAAALHPARMAWAERIPEMDTLLESDKVCMGEYHQGAPMKPPIEQVIILYSQLSKWQKIKLRLYVWYLKLMVRD
jgi:hypothetical protein